jgi:hypothetical protein
MSTRKIETGWEKESLGRKNWKKRPFPGRKRAENSIFSSFLRKNRKILAGFRAWRTPDPETMTWTEEKVIGEGCRWGRRAVDPAEFWEIVFLVKIFLPKDKRSVTVSAATWNLLCFGFYDRVSGSSWLWFIYYLLRTESRRCLVFSRRGRSVLLAQRSGRFVGELKT